ncbi:hypothetical protein HDU98_001423 [Podochytrium sp. JEL0797]|nr:hypothetical protein HDU98_001423 [Podochytrium sp. JEL0797]
MNPPAAPRPVLRRKKAAPKQTASVFALLFFVLLATSVVLLRSSQGSLPSPFPSPFEKKKDPNADPNVVVIEPVEFITNKVMELIFGPEPHFPKFDARDAKNHLDEILKFGPRPFSSEANIQTADEIMGMLNEWKQANTHGEKRMHIERDQKSVNVGPFDFPAQIRNKTFSLATDNIIVKLKGICELRAERDCPTLLVSAHYDSVVSSPGVTDDGMAISLIRLLVDDSERPLPHSVVFLLNNCEECGLLGARQFSKHPFYKSIRASINLEGGGSGGPAMLIRASDLTMLEAFAKKSLLPFGFVVGNDVMNLGLVKSTTDYAVYTENGEAGVDIAFFQKRYAYHTKNDIWKPEYITSIQHMGDSTIKTLMLMARDEKFMRGERESETGTLQAPGVYWTEVYGFMILMSFKIYLLAAGAILAWVLVLLVVGIARMRNFIAAHHRDVKNVSILSVGAQFTASLILSFVAPLLSVWVIEEIRPLAIYGQPIPARLLTLAGSLFGAMLPFYGIRSAFTTTDPNAFPANEHQEMLNWHVSQVGILFSWIPVSALVVFSAYKDVGMLYVHGGWVLFGCAAISFDWFSQRPWFGNESKQGDSEKSEPVPPPATEPKTSTDTPAPAKPTTPLKKKRSNLPDWFPVLGAGIILPFLSIVHSTHQLLLGMEPTIQDGTPALAVSALLAMYACIMFISFLPFLLTSPNTIVTTTRFTVFVMGVASLFLLNQFQDPFTIPSDAAPFNAHHPLKMAPKIEMDLTDYNHPQTTYTLTFNTLALPYLTPQTIRPRSSRCKSINAFMTECILDAAPYKINGPRIPEVAKALEVVEVQEVNRNTWTVSVRSAYSRSCFFTGVEPVGEEGRWRVEESGVYPYNVWPGTNSHRPNKLDARVGQAVTLKSKMNEVTTFTVKMNRARFEELGLERSVVGMKVGCFVDDLQYLPSWDSLEKNVVPEWAVLIGPGNGAMVVSKTFEFTL